MKIVLSRVIRLGALAVLLSVLCAVSGCDSTPSGSSSTAAASRKPSVGILLYNETDMYISLVRQAIQDSLGEKVGYEIMGAGSDPFVQNDQLDKLLARKVDALAINLVDILAASRVMDKVQKAGIPVVFFNREPDLVTLKSYSKVCFVGTTPLDAGKLQGNIISQLWKEHPEFDRNKDGKLQFIMIQANADNPESIARTEYSVRQARELGVPMQQVGDTLMCSWDEDQAYQAMRFALPTQVDTVELIISNNDSMAFGAIRALAEHGYNLENGDPAKFIPVIGVDALPQAIEAIQKKVMSATVQQDGELMGQTIAAFLLNAVNGKDFLDGTTWQWDSSGIAVRIPYAPYSGDK